MNARWELAAVLAAAGLLAALATWTTREEGPPPDVEPQRVMSLGADRRGDETAVDEGSHRSAAITTTPLQPDAAAALAQAGDAARAEDERDGPTRALEARVVAVPERGARADAVAELASRLGFAPGSADAADLATWMAESARADREAPKNASPSAFADQTRLTFNTAAKARSRALVERFGITGAEEIARRFPIHHLDPQSGALVRVDPHGSPLDLTGQD